MTVLDINGNVYKTVKIGNQIWMAENLYVDRFLNGDLIPHAKTYEEWKIAGKKAKPAWCYYDNDPNNDKKYGKLYNWYAVNNRRGLAPKGWHIPSETDFETLLNSVGGSGNNACNALNPSGSSGFSALSFGYRSIDFDYVGGSGRFWSSSSDNSGSTRNCSARSLIICSNKVARMYSCYRNSGYSVRCLQD